ncbi:MAG: hypothetical protein HQM02_02390 [Magnetococcales bacterium]|nr:hypothetical protein [Magnetococcales bacterium]
MNAQETSGSNGEFRILDPIQVFERFSTEEIARREQTDPAFEATLHLEAKQLILTRLRAQSVHGENLA